MRLVIVAASLAAACAIAGSAIAADPSVSQCIEANEQAISLRKESRFQAAKERASVCAASSCPVEIREECVRRLGDIAAAQPTIVFEIEDDAGADLSTVDVEADGTHLASELDGSALALDPGAHDFVFTARGMRSERRSFVLREGEKDRRERIVMRAIASPPLAAPPPPAPTKRSPAFRFAGASVAALGLASVGFGIFFGLRASSLWSSSQSECSPGKPCNAVDHARAVQDHDDATNAATLSTVAFAGGAGAIAVGTTLFFLAPVVTTKSAAMDVGWRF